MKELPCGCIEDEKRQVTVFRCREHKESPKFVFERYPKIKITVRYLNGKLIDEIS